MDTSIDSGSGTGTPSNGDTQGDLPVTLDTLSIDGTPPAQGDQVDVKVTGTISKVVNGTAWIKPAMVNGQPMPPDKADAKVTDDQLMQAAQKHDMASGMMG